MEALFIYLLKSAGILTIFFLAYKLLLQKETFFNLNRHYLLAGILASLLLPLVIFKSYIYVEPVILQESVFYDIPVSASDTSLADSATPLDWNIFLFNLYILGVIVVGVQFLIQLFSLYKIVNSGSAKPFNSFKLVEVSQDVSPFSFFNYIVYNPENFSEKDLEIILKHEKAHGRQLHSIDILVSQVFAIFQWFNPIVWFYKKTIQQNLEFMADKEAISKIASKKNYQRTLLKVSAAPYCTSITNNFYNSLIKKRIIMLNQTSSKAKNLWKYGLIIPVLGLFLVSFNTETVEVIKENTASMMEPMEYFPAPSEELLIPPILVDAEETDQPVVTYVKTVRSPQDQDLVVKITKDTSKEELDQIEKDLEAKGMKFSYSNLDYNSNNEITSIRIKYGDKASGSSGSYHVKGDDDEPIKNIYVYKKENGGIGIGNSPDGRDHEMHLKEHKERLQEHKERAYEHQLRMKERTEKMHAEHEERMEERRAHIEERKARLEEEHELRTKEMKERHEKMEVEHEVRLKEHKQHMEERSARMKEEQQVRIKEHRQRAEEQRARMKEMREERKMMRKNDSIVYVIRDSDDSNTFTYATGKSSDGPIEIKIRGNGKKPLYVVNGKVVSKGKFKGLKPDNISSVNVIKGQSALTMYGKEGEDGVVQVVTKKPGKNVFVYNTSVYDDVVGSSDKMYFIESSTSNRLLDSYKAKLKDQGIDFKYSGIKRNKDGEITRIKLRLNDNKGSKTSSSYDTSPDPIRTIILGKKGAKMTIDSRN